MSRRPTFRSIAIAAAVSAALVLGMTPASSLAGPIGAPAPSAAPQHAVAGEAWRLFKATNTSRARFDVPKLRLNRDLSVIARRHSMAMARRGELFHTDDVGVFLDGIQWRTWGENVGFTSQDVESMQQAFMESAPHRSNILNRAFRQVAIGSVRVDGMLWVTVFFYG